MIRFFDIVFSSLAIIIIAPILLPIMILLKFTGEGEIFYFQTRVGVNKTFELIKFATMLKNSPNMGTGTITIKDDPRILPFGRFFRKTKINELPQIINVLLGDMSLVGPRPLTKENFNFYSYDVKKILKSTKPGLSGIGSIVFRNEEEILQGKNIQEKYKELISPYKGDLEVWFSKNLSLRLYFEIIFFTIYIIIFNKHSVVFSYFQNKIPEPPDELRKFFNK